jgi:hypothetical protein
LIKVLYSRLFAFSRMFLAASLENVSASFRGSDTFLFDYVCDPDCDNHGFANACEDQLGGQGVFYGFKLAGS